MIGTRSPKQCRERYHQNLKPSLNHAPISAEEGALIERMVGEMGKRWADIARSLHGRSDNAVKNWWNGSMNRRRRIGTRQRHTSQEHNSYEDSKQHFSRSLSSRHLTIQSPTYPPSHGMELPLHSPAASEASRAESLEGAPSLMSDNGSAFSVSPRLSLSGSTDQESLSMESYRLDGYRRPSLPSIHSPYRPSVHIKDEHNSYRPFFSQSLEEKTLVPGSFLQAPFHYSSEHKMVSSSVQLPPLRLENLPTNTPVDRDQRMNVNSLLS